MNNTNINLSLAITQKLNLEELVKKNIQADILRIDLINPVISGNKWFKLKYNLKDAIDKNYESLLTFGGAYSNHIIATAMAAKNQKIKSIGVIRGEKSENLSHTLLQAQEYGMSLEFISREQFNQRHEKIFIEKLKEKYGDFYLIPEGGASSKGRLGSEEILELTDYKKYTHIMCAIGTGTMFSGLVNSSELNQTIIGIPVLKGYSNLLEEFSNYINNPEKIKYCRIFYEYHFGGYAKKTNELLNFMNSFYEKTGVPTDFVYTGKLIFSFIDLVKKDFFDENSKILLIHSGGLQGNLSLPKNILTF